ncbi:MAG: sodium-dependent transporter [Candidatus Omnitrophota bacterium]
MPDEKKPSRDSWSSKLGIILAVAGSAVGLGNFLRFPAKAVANGGGAFMIPYFVSFFLIGIPLMWIEWTLGRFGGGFGHGTAPGIFHSVTKKNRFIKYFGVIGIFGPMVIFMYYLYIESWALAYSFFSLTGHLSQVADQTQMQEFLQAFQGLTKNEFFSSLAPAYTFFLITFCLNIIVIYHGIKGGIERLSKVAMPLLFLCGLILMVRVVTLGTVNPGRPGWDVSNGFGFLWNPDFNSLKSAKVWLEAAGQVLFTLSVGIGVILTYASYLKKTDDIALSGLTAASMNEIAEVIIGGSIIVPAAFVFFGPVEIRAVVDSGIFNLGYVTMPLILQRLPLAEILSFLWFFFLFIAGITSSVSLAQPVIAFMEDEFNLSKKKTVMIFAVAAFILCQPAVLFLGKGVVDELDFWGGTFFLVIFAVIETILFSWVFGMEAAWDEIHLGSDMTIPGIYKFIIKYVTPLFLLIILVMWFFQEWLPVILMTNIPEQNRIYILATRAGLFLIFTTIALMVKIAWRRKRLEGLI